MWEMLDNLNVFYALEQVRKAAPDTVLAFGPKDIKQPDNGGTVIWHRPKGYAHYKTLTLFGVWAVDGDTIIAGTRSLAYAATHYNPESYFHHLARDFSIYYGKAAPPDADGQQLQVRYTPKARLALRQQINALCQTYW